jgi:hypothetical protein
MINRGRGKIPIKPPLRPPPWTPFGPGDTVPLDAGKVQAEAQKLHDKVVQVREKLDRVRRGLDPDGPEGPDDRYRLPVHTKRSEQLLPFLVIRTYPGDFGARPIDPTKSPTAYRSPDILTVTPLPAGASEPDVRGRDQFDAAFQARIVDHPQENNQYDIWVHVWNLGRAPAYGVRVRAWAEDETPPGDFIGGRRIDLGDRNSPDSHRAVKVGSLLLTRRYSGLWANAECLLDVSSGTTFEALTSPSFVPGQRDEDPFKDRHTAYFSHWLGHPSP